VLSREVGLAWVDAPVGANNRIQCARLDARQGGDSFATRPTGCGGLGLQTAGPGSTALGDGFTLQHVVTQGFMGFVVGLPTDQPIAPCPSCRMGVQGSTLFGTSYHFDVPRNAAFVGLTLSFQGFQIDLPGAGGACLAQINLTDTLDATVR
jgi:hypothetical protein